MSVPARSVSGRMPSVAEACSAESSLVSVRLKRTHVRRTHSLWGGATAACTFLLASFHGCTPAQVDVPEETRLLAYRLLDELANGVTDVAATSAYNDVIARMPTDRLNVLILQDDHLVVSHAAFVAIVDRDPQRATWSALRKLAETQHPLNAWLEGMMAHIMTLESNNANTLLLKDLSRHPGKRLLSLSIVAHTLPFDLVQRTLDEQGKEIDQPLRAMLIETYIARSPLQSPPRDVPAELRSEVASYRDASGYPRLVYVSLTCALDEAFRKALLETITDPQLDEALVTGLLRLRGGMLEDDDLLQLKVPSNRRNTIQSYVRIRKKRAR